MEISIEKSKVNKFAGMDDLTAEFTKPLQIIDSLPARDILKSV